jgi:hypothetical protein
MENRYIIYSDLPPGRQRRLLYDKQFKQIQSIKRLLRRFALRNQTLHNQSLLETFNTFSLEEEEQFDLEPVYISLSVKKLFENSCVNINLDENKLCIICQENIDVFSLEKDKNISIDKLITRKLKCNHIFHIQCIDKWLSYNKKCPLCKNDMDENC